MLVGGGQTSILEEGVLWQDFEEEVEVAME